MNILPPIELVSKLKSQHKQLQEDLNTAIELAKEKMENAEKIVDNLQLFKNHINEHIALEDSEFYTQYIEIKEKRGEDISKTKQFMFEMKDIGKVVMEFLQKYSLSNAIREQENFSTELIAIKNTLNMRIETEENGIYDIFLVISQSSIEE